MRTLYELFTALKSWKQSPDSENPFNLACRIESGASANEIESACSRTGNLEELSRLWSASRESWLFEDSEYGQWGLHLLSPAESIIRTEAERLQREGDLRRDDLVIGEFLGDSELLVYAPSEDQERRCLIALPLDRREDWYSAGKTVAEVIERLLAADGEKYWEQSSN